MKKYKGVCISGGCLNGRIDGIPRVLYETIKELDKYVGGLNVVLALSDKNTLRFDFKNIEIVRLPAKDKGGRAAHFDIAAERYAIKHKLMYINFGNNPPLFSKGITFLHDVIPEMMQKQFKQYRPNGILGKCKWVIVHYCLVHHTKMLVTASHYSEEMIRKVLGYKKEIRVIYPAWQHILERVEDEGALEKYGLKSRAYYFSLGNLNPHKNSKWVLEVAKKNPGSIFAVSGRKALGDYSDLNELNNLPNVKMLGYVSDEEMKTLAKNAKALLFPTLIEGFGIPPLEAMGLGAPSIVSDIPCLREVYGDSVYYIDPYDYNVDLEKVIKERQISGVEETLNKYSWNKCAVAWADIIKGQLSG